MSRTTLQETSVCSIDAAALLGVILATLVDVVTTSEYCPHLILTLTNYRVIPRA